MRVLCISTGTTDGPTLLPGDFDLILTILSCILNDLKNFASPDRAIRLSLLELSPQYTDRSSLRKSGQMCSPGSLILSRSSEKQQSKASYYWRLNFPNESYTSCENPNRHRARDSNKHVHSATSSIEITVAVSLSKGARASEKVRNFICSDTKQKLN
ncbi:hypothetical protein MJO28_006108 [Puccinia striiformis f. sp. tritici]|uniref:Uncharacterized protein n=1 Tax=Puccinia striiformis f. sp. tritici TaxID=168172 RepID=A0ACC0EJG1_9BASI|nr:hypothetical protein MJO28_006108 [Puccinia striiformis f. sp. tritici]